MSLRPTALVSLVLLLAGCAGDPEPAPGPGSEPGFARDRPQGEYTGTWRRAVEDGADYVFEVLDDGHTIRGEMTAGLPQDCLSYVFDLQRGEQALEGSSLVRFAEEDGGVPTSYSTQWKNARREGDMILIEQQWIQVDEFGDVVESGWSDVSYAFDCAVEADERAEGLAKALAKIDAPHRVTIGPEAGIGMGVVLLWDDGQLQSAWGWMLVDETDEAWRVELTGGPLLQDVLLSGMIMGLTVSKQNGHVTRAVVGNPGEAGTEIAVNEQTVPRPEELESTPEEITIQAGTFATEKVESRHGTSWVGTEGDAQGILLKWIGEDVSYELAEALTTSEVELASGHTLAATVAVYTNEMRWTLTRDQVVRTFFPYDRGTASGEWGFLELEFLLDEYSKVHKEVIEVRDDASPLLRWD